MTTAEDVLRHARSQIGVREAPDGSNPYGRAYGADRVAWCAQFLWWCFREASAEHLLGGKTAYTPTLADQFRRAGRFDSSPRVGDIAFFDWPDSIRRIQHVGIVEVVEPDAVVTIEGNTSTSNQSDGGGVMRRRRARTAAIVGYGHPAFAPAPRHASAPKPARAREDDMTPEDRERLARVEQKLDLLIQQLVTGEANAADPRWGWTTWGGGTNERLTPVDYWRRANVETRVARDEINAGRAETQQVVNSLAKEVGELAAEVRALREGHVAGEVVLSAQPAIESFEFTGTARIAP